MGYAGQDLKNYIYLFIKYDVRIAKKNIVISYLNQNLIISNHYYYRSIHKQIKL